MGRPGGPGGPGRPGSPGNRPGGGNNINSGNNININNPVYGGGGAYGWNGGYAWAPAPYYWGGGFWGAIGSLNDNFGLLGYLIVGIFIVAWLVSYLIYRAKNYDEIEISASSLASGSD